MEKEELRKKDREAKQILFYIRKGEYNSNRKDSIVIGDMLNVVRYLDHRISNIEKGVK